MIIVILAVTDFHSSATKMGINHTPWCSLTVLLNLNGFLSNFKGGNKIQCTEIFSLWLTFIIAAL